MVFNHFITKKIMKQEETILKKNKFIVHKVFDKFNFQKNIGINKISRNSNIKFITFKFKNACKHRLIKFHKYVYTKDINICNNHSELKNLISSKKYKKGNRSCSYRGVSKNGKKWQVSIMKHNKNYYLGNYISEENAAKIYDIFNIKLRGKKAVTNFLYDDEQIEAIKKMNTNYCFNKKNKISI